MAKTHKATDVEKRRAERKTVLLDNLTKWALYSNNLFKRTERKASVLSLSVSLFLSKGENSF